MGPSEKKIYLLKPHSSQLLPEANLVCTSPQFLDLPEPEVLFEGRSFCFTGVFVYGGGDRAKCETAIRARGGYCYQRPNRDLNYLVIGTFVEPSWAHQNYGRKIETTLELKRVGSRCKIISEKL